MRNFFLTLLAAASVASADDLKRAAFETTNEYRIPVPEGAKRVRAWFVLPQEDPAQAVQSLEIEAPAPTRVETDSEGNRILYLEVENPTAREIVVRQRFVLVATEVRASIDPKATRPLDEAERATHAADLSPEAQVVIDDRIRTLAGEIAGDETNPILVARKLYDWVLGHVEYWVKDPKNKKASGLGSTIYGLEQCTGNCTDIHSLWISLARARGLPARMVYGSFFKKELDGQDVDQSYHCWPEFFAPNIGWIPHDVAVADIFSGGFEVNPDNETPVRRTTADGYTGPDPAKVEYYFGNLEERRMIWSRGRDIVLTPRQDGPPVNMLPKAYVEVDGKPLAEGKDGWTRKLTYRERAIGE